MPAIAEAHRTITVGEAASMPGIGRALAYNLAKRGELPGVRRLGGKYVVVREQVERFLDGEEQSAA